MIANLLRTAYCHQSDPPLGILWMKTAHKGGFLLSKFSREDRLQRLEKVIKRARNKVFAHLHESDDLQTIIKQNFCAFSIKRRDHDSQKYAQKLVHIFCEGCGLEPSTKYILHHGTRNSQRSLDSLLLNSNTGAVSRKSF